MALLQHKEWRTRQAGAEGQPADSQESWDLDGQEVLRSVGQCQPPSLGRGQVFPALGAQGLPITAAQPNALIVLIASKPRTSTQPQHSLEEKCKLVTSGTQKLTKELICNRKVPFLPLLSVLLWGTLLWAGWTFTLGVLGPWDCDPIFAQAFPSVAAQLAVNQANQDSSLALGSQLTSVVLPTGCDTSSALATFLAHKNTVAVFVGPVNPGYCPAAALLAQGWEKTLFPWVCGVPEGGGVLVLALPSATHVLLSVIRHFGWAHVAIVSSHQDIWLATAWQVAMTLRAYGLPVGLVTSLRPGKQGATEVLKQLCNVDGLKIAVLCTRLALLGGSEQPALLSRAGAQGLADGRLAFLPYDTLLFTLPYCNRSYPAPGDGRHLQEACGAVLSAWSPASDTRTSKLPGPQRGGCPPGAGAGRSVQTFAGPGARGHGQVSPPFGTTYDAVFLLAHALNSSESHGAGLSGTHLGDHTGSLDVAGFSQRIWTDEKGRRLAQYVILDTDGRGSQLVPTHILDTSTWQVQPLGRAIHFPGGTPPVRDSSCWFDLNTLCMRGNGNPILPEAQAPSSPHTPHPACYCSGLPAGLPASALVLDLTVAGWRILGKHSQIWLSPAQGLQMPPLPGGEWVWLKKFEAGTAPELRPSCLSLLRKMRELRHENIATFLDFFVAPGVSALVLEHRARGSLEDLLRNEDLRLDWTFKASLVLDMIRGVWYLHHRHFPHGRLKSRNCVVAGRFVLQVTDHGYAELLDAQRAARPRPAPEELLWTAPELLRGPGGPGRGTLKGDTFSIGIILQGVLTWGPPYGSPGLSAEEIIRKVVSPPPLCQPLVSPDHGPPECIQLMEQCWEEAPEDRPNLDQICTQFKSINQGKKTSVADSMLRMLEKYSQNLEDLIQEWTEELELERQKLERLLSQMLLPSVAEALKMGATVEPEYFDQVTIYFSDTVGFTTISALSEPIEVVGLLNDLYTLFDVVLGNHDVYKVETIGDAMVAVRLPRNRSQHAAEITDMALDILSSVGDFRMRHAPTVPIRIRVGPHSGPCMAGVVGLTMPQYCLFGDTVNTASRMESTGLHESYRIHVCISTAQTLLSLDEGYKIDIRGQTELKGRGFKETYWLVGKAGFPRPLPTPLDIKPWLPTSDFTAVGPPPHFCLHGQPGFSEGLSADADFTSSSSSPAGPRSLTSTTTHPEGSVRSPVPSTHVTSSVGSFSYQPDCMLLRLSPRSPSKPVVELDLNSKDPTTHALLAALSATASYRMEKSDAGTVTASVTSRRVRPAKGNANLLSFREWK
ncbi:LOW QUALITY PROTEIN: guanylate cyclase 2D-like [Megaptera novaeangliae]